MVREKEQLDDWFEANRLAAKAAKEKKRLDKFRKQKEKREARMRKSGRMSISSKPARSASATVIAMDQDATEKHEFSEVEFLAACTIQSAWRVYRTKQMFGIGKEKEASMGRSVSGR